MNEDRQSTRWLRRESTKSLVKDYTQEPHPDINRELSRRARRRNARARRMKV